MLYKSTEYTDVKLPCNRENMTKFVEALESGKYLAGQGRLRKSYEGKSEFCCLGVACDVSGVGQWVTENDQLVYSTEPEGASAFYLPESVMSWLGLEDPGSWALILSGEAKDKDNNGIPYVTGAALNDSGFSFAEIATVIRQVYLED